MNLDRLNIPYKYKEAIESYMKRMKGAGDDIAFFGGVIRDYEERGLVRGQTAVARQADMLDDEEMPDGKSLRSSIHDDSTDPGYRDIEGGTHSSEEFSLHQISVLDRYDKVTGLGVRAVAYPDINAGVMEEIMLWDIATRRRELVPQFWILGRSGIRRRDVISIACELLVDYDIVLSDMIVFKDYDDKAWDKAVAFWKSLDEDDCEFFKGKDAVMEMLRILMESRKRTV